MVMPGDNVSLTVELIAPIAMEEKLRFAIREGGRTVGAGVVLKTGTEWRKPIRSSSSSRCAQETSKVTWPTRRETIITTIMVLIMVGGGGGVLSSVWMQS
jgi:hypothetical protein